MLIAAAAAREVITGRNWWNLPPVGVLIVFIAGNVIFHIEAYEGSAERIGIAAAIALITLIGGRVIPSFTRNWLACENPGRLPVPFGRFDVLSLMASILAVIMWIVSPDLPATAALMLIACVAHSMRLVRWAGDRTLRDRLVLILHITYVFVPFGFLLLSGAILFPQDVPASAGIHAWATGAIGICVRASRGVGTDEDPTLAAGPQ